MPWDDLFGGFLMMFMTSLTDFPAILWFHDDLRLADHSALHAAVETAGRCCRRSSWTMPPPHAGRSLVLVACPRWRGR